MCMSMGAALWRVCMLGVFVCVLGGVCVCVVVVGGRQWCVGGGEGEGGVAQCALWRVWMLCWLGGCGVGGVEGDNGV